MSPYFSMHSYLMTMTALCLISTAIDAYNCKDAVDAVGTLSSAGLTLWGITLLMQGH